MTMPAGKYYIGDLCYVMHPQWDQFCQAYGDGERELANGVRFATYCTKYGDGGYRGSDGKTYCVDAGLIGCIKVDDIDDPDADGALNDLGHVVEFKNPFNTGRTKDGTIWFGHIKIPTGDME